MDGYESGGGDILVVKIDVVWCCLGVLACTSWSCDALVLKCQFREDGRTC